MTIRSFGLCALLAVGLAAPLARAADRAPFITYGPAAKPQAGDDDFVQLFFLEVPAHTAGTLYLRLYDPDCGGSLDETAGSEETRTRFSLYGGPKAFTAPTVRTATPTPEDRSAGTRIASEEFGPDRRYDLKWYTLASFSAGQGEQVGDRVYFKLVVEGVKGAGGNVFEPFLSTAPDRNAAPGGSRILSFAPTLRLDTEALAELRLSLPAAARGVTLHGFDMGGARLSLETAFHSLPMDPMSEDGSWDTRSVQLPADVQGGQAALTVDGGAERPNDLTLYLTAEGAADPLPIELPVSLRGRNHRPAPSASAAPTADCRVLAFDASRSTDADNDALEMSWDFGDGQTEKGPRVTHRYERAGRYEAVVSVLDGSGHVGNGARLRVPVTVNAPPVAVARVEPVATPGQRLSFDGSGSSDPDGKLIAYAWDFGDGATGQGVRASHAYERPGRYRVQLQVEDDSKSACRTALDTQEVWINAGPTARIDAPRAGAPGEALTFDASRSSDPDGKLRAWRWDFGDGARAEGANVSHAYAEPGRYTIKLTVEDDAGAANSAATDARTIAINRPPVAKAGEDRRAAVGELLRFDGSRSSDADGRIVSYQWSFGDGATGEGKQVSYAYDKPGTYKVELRVKDDSGTRSDEATDSLTVVVNEPPVANPGGDQVVTASEIHFDATSSRDPDGKIVQYAWDFGDGTRQSEAAPTHVFRSPGTYKVKLTVRDDANAANSQTSGEVTVVVNQLPIADAGRDQRGAPGQLLTFYGTESVDPDGEISAYHWDFGDGATADGPVATHAYAKPGIYTARLTVRDNSGHPNAVGEDTVVVRINAPPRARAGADVVAAPGQPLSLDGGGSYDPDGKIASYEWTFSDGQGTTRSQKVTRAFEKPGMYVATLTVTDDSGAPNGRAQDRLLIRINHRPEAVAGKSVATCETTLRFGGLESTDADGDPLTYSWDFGDGSPPEPGDQVLHTYAKGGTYPVVLTVDDGTGLPNARHSASLTVSINQPPIANSGGDRLACAGETVIFNGGKSQDPENGPLKYRWSFGDGTSAEGLNPTKIYKRGGVYPVLLTVEDDSGLSCNQATDQSVIRVGESPVADAGPDQKVCANTEVHLDGSKSRDFAGLVSSYSWDFGDGQRGGGATPTHVYTAPGRYVARLTIQGERVGECDNTHTDEAIITVVEAPVASYKGPAAAAQGETVSFDASASLSRGSSIVAYAWDFGDGEKGEGPKVTHAYARPGRYLPTLTVRTDSGTACSATSTRNLLVVNAAPLPVASGPKRAGVDQVVVFDASESRDPDGSIVSYQWDFGDGSKASGVTVRHQYKKSGAYQATLTVTDDTATLNRSAAATVAITVNAAPEPAIDAPDKACPGEAVAFSGKGSRDPDGQIASFQWDFGDEQGGSGPEATHAYARPGRYQVTLIADDGTGVDNSRAKRTRPIAINHPPRANAGPDRLVCPGDAVTFNGSGSLDRDGDALAYHWSFGDGGEGEGAVVPHTFEKPGRYEVRLEARDDSGTSCAKGEDTAVVRVNGTPVAEAGGDREAFTGGALDAVVFDATKSVDPEGEPLTYFWDFGDGTNDAGAVVSHAYRKPGRYRARLRVRDATGTRCGEGWATVTVDVKARPALEARSTGP